MSVRWTVIEYEGALSTYAEISATIAGFVGIITVFGGRWERGQWSDTERRLLQTMLLVILTSLGAALLPLALSAAVENQAIVWRCANGFLGVCHIALLVWSLPVIRAGPINGIPRGVGSASAVIGTVTHVAQIAVGIGFLSRWAPFVLLWGLWWGLFVGAFAFVVLLFSNERALDVDRSETSTT